MLELLFIFAGLLIIPPLLDKSMEHGPLDWMSRDNLRTAWMVIGVFFTIYALSKTEVMEIAMSLHKKLNPALGYFLFGMFGMLLFMGFWYFTGKALSETKPAIFAERTAKFATMIPFDTAPKSIPIPLDENPDDPLFRTYWELQSLATSGTIPKEAREQQGNQQISWEVEPVSVDDAPDFIGKVLQYYILRSVDDLQRDTITVGVGVVAGATAGIEPPNAEPYSYHKLTKELSGNVFFKPFLHRNYRDDMAWKVKPISMPKGTEIKLTKRDRAYVVTFARPRYFTADFTVTSFSGTGVGSIPKDFVSSKEKTIMQWNFIVKMHYQVLAPKDDPEFNPASYVQWLDSLYGGLEKRLVHP